MYQDAHLVLVNKPAGLLAVPARNPQNHDSVVARLKHQFDYLQPVHRLDMATSGLMLLALNPQARANLGRQFERRQVAKSYHAICYGIPKQPQFNIDLPLICDWPRRPRQKVSFEYGKAASTQVAVIGVEVIAGVACARLLLTPITGRSHQLRLHLAALGLPLLGCEFYAHQAAYNLSKRLLLHASALTFCHPHSGQCLQLCCCCPF